MKNGKPAREEKRIQLRTNSFLTKYPSSSDDRYVRPPMYIWYLAQTQIMIFYDPEKCMRISPNNTSIIFLFLVLASHKQQVAILELLLQVLVHGKSDSL